MLKPTQHAKTNYRMLKPYLDAADQHDGHARFLSGAYMPLVVENLGYTVHGGQVYSITHYGELNGDAMRDPDMTLSVDRKAGTVDPLTYQQDYMGLYQEVYLMGENGRERYRPTLRTSLDRFLWQWLKNIQDQGFDPAVIDRSDDEPEEDDFPDVDPAELRAKLEKAGIMNGELVDPAALENDPFIQQVMADVDRIAAEEKARAKAEIRADFEAGKLTAEEVAIELSVNCLTDGVLPEYEALACIGIEPDGKQLELFAG